MASPSVSVGLRMGDVIVTSTYSPGPGTYVDKFPAVKSLSTDAVAIGNNVLSGLDQFVDGGPWPVDWSSYQSPTLAVAGIPTWQEYERGLRTCVVERHEDHLCVRSERPHQTLSLDVTKAQIGEAVLQSLGTTLKRERAWHERHQSK